MSALLEALAPHAEEVALRMRPRRPSTVVLYGPPGGGKAAIVRSTARLLNDGPVVTLRATGDALAPRTAVQTIVGSLEERGYRATPPNAVDDDWPFLLGRAAGLMSEANRDGLVIGVSDADRLDRLAASGGTPGRHAAELLDLLDDSAPRLLLTRMLPHRTDRDPIALGRADLSAWLTDRTVWGPLADAAAEVADRGPAWTTLPALTVRLCVALASLKQIPKHPPDDSVAPARSLADALAGVRSLRTIWAAWQLLAAVRSPWQVDAVDELLADLPAARDEPILTQCLTFAGADGLHMHPLLRTIAVQPQGPAAARLVAPSLLLHAGRRGVEHFRSRVDATLASGLRGSTAHVQAQLVDCAALAGDPELAEELGEDLPDAYDHVGQHTPADQSTAARRGYELACSIDETDTTALRGLADLADDDAREPARVEQLLRQVLVLEPADLASHARLVELLLAAGRPAAAEQAFEQGRVLAATPLDAEAVVGSLLAPVAAGAVAHGNIPLAVRAARLAAERQDSQHNRELRQLAESLVEVLEYGEFTTIERLGTPWWSAPDKLSGRHNGQPRKRWLAGRVDHIANGMAHIHYADVERPDNRPDVRSWLELELDALAEMSDDPLPTPLIGAIVEIGLYGPAPQLEDDPEQEVVVRWLPGREFVLPSASRSPDRYAHGT